MTDLRETILRRLREKAPALADLYGAAIKLVDEPDFPARGYLIAHACREIRNGLPIIYGAEPDPEVKIRAISADWRDQVSALISQLATTPTEPIPVPRLLVEHVERMVSNELDLDRKKRRQFNTMCDAINPSTLRGFTDPTIATTWIQSRPDRLAHVKREPYAAAKGPEQAIEAFLKIEEVLAALYSPADEAIPELEDLIREANEG